MNNTDFTHQLMKAIQQTDEWDRIWQEDLKLQEAKAQLDEAMEQISSQIPAELRDNLWTSMCGLNADSEIAAILYGIRVAITIRGAAAPTSATTSLTVESPLCGGGQANIDKATDAKLWEIRRYVDSVQVQGTMQSLPTTKELLALGQFAGNSLYDAVLLAFAYGRAKGWQAAKGEATV